jgi:beta-glucosidase
MKKNSRDQRIKEKKKATPRYRDPNQSATARNKDLLSRMTLEEKAAQMICVWQEKANTLVDPKGKFDLRKARANFKKGLGLGQVGRPSDAAGGLNARATAQLTSDSQRFFLEESRLGIPVIFYEECLHGHAAVDSTSFPQPIGLAATFNPDLVERLFTMTAAEARVRGTHQALTPVVDVARDSALGTCGRNLW